MCFKTRKFAIFWRFYIFDLWPRLYGHGVVKPRKLKNWFVRTLSCWQLDGRTDKSIPISSFYFFFYIIIKLDGKRSIYIFLSQRDSHLVCHNKAEASTSVMNRFGCDTRPPHQYRALRLSLFLFHQKVLTSSHLASSEHGLNCITFPTLFQYIYSKFLSHILI